MISKSNEFYEYKQLKIKIKMIKGDIIFLQKCKRMHWIPKFMKLSCKTVNGITTRLLQFSYQKWLKLEINHKFSELNYLDLISYRMHKNISNAMDPIHWDMLDKELNEILIHKFKQKMLTIKSKWNKLRDTHEPKPCVKHINNIVNNFSSAAFSESEMNLLNRGLNFALPPKEFPLNDIIEDIETGIFYSSNALKQNVRGISKSAIQIARNVSSTGATTLHRTLESLRDKDVYYCKADKGNSIVILDKQEYDQRMMDAISEGPYTEITDPLKHMVMSIKSVIREHENVFENGWKYRMYNSNPSVPRIYGLPKIHKPGNKMRFIVSNINSPSHNVAKFLVKEFSSLKQFDDFSIKNAFELVDYLKNIRIEDDEVLVSFDITAYFPSVPINGSLSALQLWLFKQPNIPPLKLKAYIELAYVCMNQNQFTFRGKCYKQNSGTAMGNPLSPFMCNLFMLKLENLLRKEEIFPRVWKRYVDDVFAIVKRDKLADALNLINSICSHIQFTHEIETNGQIAFLDLLITRDIDGTLSIDIYRKPTHTDRYITNDSFHHHSHKHAAFNSMIYRLVNLPLNRERFIREWEYIVKVADLNGFHESLMLRLLERHQRKLLLHNTTSFVADNMNNKRISVHYHPALTYKLDTECKKHGISIVASSKNLKVRTMLGSTKDKIDSYDCSGVYQFSCPDRECMATYIGETRRSLNVRADEHIKSTTSNRPEKSAIAEHAIEYGHAPIQISDFRLLSTTSHNTRLKVCESIHIHRNSSHLINKDFGHVTNSCLFDLL